MGISKQSPVLIVVDKQDEELLFKAVLNSLGFQNFHIMHELDEAYEHAVRSSYELIICGLDFPNSSGTILLQKLRASGNYGLEPFLFVGKKIGPDSLAILAEYDIRYVIIYPISHQKIKDKINYIIKNENSLSPAYEAYLNARSFYNSQMYDLALEVAEASDKVPELQEKWSTLLGDCHIGKGDLVKSLNFYQEALEINPSSVAAKNKLAKIHMLKGEYQEATQILNQLAESNPYHIQVLENAGLSNIEVGNEELAEKQMGRLHELDKTNKVCSVVKTKIQIKRKDYSNICDSLKESHDEKEIVNILNEAGVKLTKENNIQAALDIYKQVLGIVTTPEFKGKILYNIALAHIRNKDYPSAEESLKLSDQFYPELVRARQLLQQLEAQKKAS